MTRRTHESAVCDSSAPKNKPAERAVNLRMTRYSIPELGIKSAYYAGNAAETAEYVKYLLDTKTRQGTGLLFSQIDMIE